jgi:hypothetical protein
VKKCSLCGYGQMGVAGFMVGCFLMAAHQTPAFKTHLLHTDRLHCEVTTPGSAGQGPDRTHVKTSVKDHTEDAEGLSIS